MSNYTKGLRHYSNFYPDKESIFVALKKESAHITKSIKDANEAVKELESNTSSSSSWWYSTPERRQNAVLEHKRRIITYEAELARNKEYKDLVENFKGDFFKLPNELKRNSKKIILGQNWYSIGLLKVGYKCQTCGAVAKTEFDKYHLGSDNHVRDAYMLKYGAEPVSWQNHRHIKLLKTMGMTEQIRGVWLVRKGLNEAVEIREKIAEGVEVYTYYESLGADFVMPSLI